MKSLMWLIGLMLICHTAFAVPNEQIAFSREQSDGAIHYTYQWHDHANQPRTLSFSLNTQAVQALPRAQANYLPEVAMDFVRADLLRYAKTIDPRKARLNISRFKERLDVSVRSNDSAVVAEIQQELNRRQQDAQARYLEENYFETFTSATGEEAIKVDHIRYFNEFVELMKPAAQALYEQIGEGGTPRHFIDLVLSWVQSIPYNELTGRGAGNGAGFLPPVTLLDANLGDCDSKSVLAAAVIRNLLPQAPFRLVILPAHALLAIAIRPTSTDYPFEEDGRPFVLLEPTGPAPFKTGDIAVSSKRDFERGLVTLQTLP